MAEYNLISGRSCRRKRYMNFTSVLFYIIFHVICLSSNLSRCHGQIFDPNNGGLPSPSAVQPTSEPLVTQTVYGFLDFTTTIGNTLMIFSPQSQAPESNSEVTPSVSPVTTETLLQSNEEIESLIKNDNLESSTVITIKPTKTSTTTVNKNSDKKVDEQQKEKTTIVKKPSLSSVVNIKSVEETKLVKPSIISSIIEVKSDEKPNNTPSVVVVVNSKIDEKSISKPENIKANHVDNKKVIKPTVLSSVVNVAVSNGNNKQTITSSKVEVLSDSNKNSDEEPAISSNNLDGEAEYDFLSRQPSEVVDETYKVIDIRTPNSKVHHGSHHNNKQPRSSNNKQDNKGGNHGGHGHPTGLVTSMGGTIVKDGVTTVHETNVIGTYISGKYAQVLQSTSHIYQQQNNKKHKISPSQSSQQPRILKTLSPNLKSNIKVNLEPTPASSTLQEDSALPLEALFNSPSGNLIRQSRRPAVAGAPNYKNRFSSNNNNRHNRFNNKEQEQEQDLIDLEEQVEQITPQPNYKKNRPRDRERNNSQQQQQSNSNRPFKFSNNRFSRPKESHEIPTVSVYSEQVSSNSGSGSSRKYQKSPTTSTSSNTGNRRANFKPSNNNNNNVENEKEKERENRRNFKPSKTFTNDHSTSSLYKFKLSRPSGRWQYKTTPKPRVTIRRQDNDLDASQQQQQQQQQQLLSSNDDDNDEDVSTNLNNETPNQQLNQDGIEPTIPIETLKIEISTPADFKNTYYEIATLKSPYTFQVGTVKNTRFITVTTTIEKSLVEPTAEPSLQNTEPLTENILATATAHLYDNKEPPLDSSIATLPAIALAGDAETPPLETMTETFSTTQLMLKTHILPVIRGANNTTSYTLVQSYHVTRTVTAIKTLPPMEVYQFVPSKTLNEFNTRLDEAGSELNFELEFGDNNDQNDDDNVTAARIFPSDLDLANVGSDFDLSDMDKTKFLTEAHLRLKKAHQNNQLNAITTTEQPTTPGLTPEQLQQLALLRYLNPNAVPPVITSSKPIIKLETVYESHVIPLFNGQSTLFSTISRPIATVTKTDYEVVTSSVPIPQPPVPLNPLFPQQNPQQQQQLQPQQQQFAITSTPVITQTVVTETDSKVLKLTFGAKTAYTTLYSTKVVPTVLTTYLTASVPVQPTVAFPGYFPAPYNPFQFAG